MIALSVALLTALLRPPPSNWAARTPATQRITPQIRMAAPSTLPRNIKEVVAQLRELTFPPPPDLLEAARRPGPRRRSPVMKKPQPPLGRRPATGKAPTASTSLRDTRRPETAGAISRPLLASMLATRTTKYL